MAEYLLGQGAIVVILDYKDEIVNAAINNLKKNNANVAGFVCNAMDESSLKETSDKIIDKFGKIDVLINVAGGNMPGATIAENQTIFDVNIDHFKKVVDLNLFGSILPSLVLEKKWLKANKA